MGIHLLIKIFLLQLAIAAVIVFILKKILDNMLIDLASRHFDLWMHRQQTQDHPAEKISFISHKPLKPKNKEKFLKIMTKYSKQKIQPVFERDKSILGGVIIKGSNDILDFSLKTRLEEALRRN